MAVQGQASPASAGAAYRGPGNPAISGFHQTVPVANARLVLP